MAAAQKNSPDALKSIDELQMMEQQADTEELPGVGLPLLNVLAIQRLEIAAVASAAKGKLGEATKSIEKAIAVEESVLPVPGPPPVIKPPHELFGEILLQADHPGEAEKQFGTALLRQTNRARSILGVARAAARQGSSEIAMNAYATFLRHNGSGAIKGCRNYRRHRIT